MFPIGSGNRRWLNHEHLAPHYSNTGRHSIDSALPTRVLFGYGFGIRSGRQLCEEVHLNLVSVAELSRRTAVSGRFRLVNVVRLSATECIQRLRHALARYGFGGPELLREHRYAPLLDQPAQRFQ